MTNTPMPSRTHGQGISGAVNHRCHTYESAIDRGARYLGAFITEVFGNVSAFCMKYRGEAAELLKSQVSWVE